jgi:hypothetical protein
VPLKSIRSELRYRWRNRIRGVHRHLPRLGNAIYQTLYSLLGTIHLALVTDAGLLIWAFALPLFGDQLIPKNPISLAFLASYVVCDLIRLPFLHGVSISLGFPLIFLTLLADSPFAALFNATLGSLLSETLRSKYVSRQHLPWFHTVRRALFYAGHHAVAGLGALLSYQLILSYFDPWLLRTIHIPATLAYVIVYSLVSMLLIWPHDRRIHLFLVRDEEPFVRIDLLTTTLLLPLPACVFYLSGNTNLGQTERIFVIAGVLPPLFLLLFILARHVTKTEEERERLALREEVSRRLGSPANTDEMVERMLAIMGQLIDYRWGAVYGLTDTELRLYDEKLHQDSVMVHDLVKADGAKTRTEGDSYEVKWPLRVQWNEETSENLTKACARPHFFYNGLVSSTPLGLYLPHKTALIAFPISVERPQGGRKGPPQLIGLITLARPNRMFNTWDWEKGQALSSKVGNILLGVQRLEQTLQELYQKVESYAKDPERVRQAMQELILQKVDVSRILAVISDRSFHGNLRDVLRGILEQRGSEISLNQAVLTEIYNYVRDQTPGMPPLDPNILQSLQTITSSLSLAFSFRYQFPDVERGSIFKELYEFLLAALEANTTASIALLDAEIEQTIRAVKVTRHYQIRSGLDRSSDILADIIEEIEKLRDIVDLLKEQSKTKDSSTRTTLLCRGLDLLAECTKTARDRLRDPERFILLQILADWQMVITNALRDLACGPARLRVNLRSQFALALNETTVSLVIQNDGPGVASNVIAQLEPSPGYQVLRDKADLGALTVGKVVEPEFTLRPLETNPLRLQFCITYHDTERKNKAERFADLLNFQELLPPSPSIRIANPYTPGNPLRPGNPTFVGREDMFEFIRRNISSAAGKTLVLVGERRTGKTSILQQLPIQLKDPGVIPIYIDCQGLGIDPGIENFFLKLAEIIADGLEQIGIFIRRMTLSELEESPQHIFERRFLSAVREQIGQRTLLLTIDEFEELGDRVSRNRLPLEIFSYLRHLIQHGEQLAFIFAGTHKIEELQGDQWSILLNMATYRKVGFLERNDAIRLITEPMQPYGIVYDGLAIEEILRLTACHPCFTQLLCSILVQQCCEASCRYVTIQNVRDVVEDLVDKSIIIYLSYLWKTSSPQARVILAALAELRDKLDQVTAIAIAESLGSCKISLDLGQITKTMEQLTARDIVSEIPGSSVSYDLTAQLYTHWLRRYKSLSKVVEEERGEFIPAAE